MMLSTEKLGKWQLLQEKRRCDRLFLRRIHSQVHGLWLSDDGWSSPIHLISDLNINTLVLLEKKTFNIERTFVIPES